MRVTPRASPLYLLVSYSGAFGGAERVLVDVATGLVGEVCVACPEGPLADRGRAAGLRVLALRARSLRLRGAGRAPARLVTRARASAELAGHAAQLARLLDGLAPDVLVLWGMRSALAWPAVARSPAGRAFAGRVVFAHHDLLPPGRVIARLVHAAATSADVVVANSDTVAADLRRWGELGARLTVVYPGVEVPAQPPPWPPGAPVVVVVGALVAFKRIELALEAVALARIAVPSLQLRIVGDALDEHGAALSRRLRARAAQPDLAGAVRFTGPVDDVGPELGRASCLLHCADREPFGLVVAEALAHGRPVVVPDTGGAAEIADLECAVLYRAGNADAAAAGVVSLVADGERAQALGAAGRARVTQRFGRERMRREFARVLTPPTRAAPATDAPLALVTVSFNSARPLLALLDSVARHLPGVRVIVVDCGSVDDSAAVAEAHPVAVSVAAGSNLGFGRGSNLGLPHVSEPVTVFVNPDVELLDDSLRSLAAAALAPGFERRLLAPLVLSSDGSRQDTVHPRPGAAAELARLALPPRLVPGPLGAALAPWRSRRPTRVGWAVGCALAARTETFRALGPFSDQIFIYGEDLELGLRAAGAGVETWFWPAARVLHHRAHATAAAYGGEPFAVLARARHRAIAMTLGEHAACADDRRQAALFGSRALIKRALGRDPARELAQLRAVRRR